MSAVTADPPIETRRATPFDGVPVWVAAIAGGLGGIAAALLPERGAGLVVIAPFVIAAIVDLRTRRIPNPLSAAAVALALTVALASGEGVGAVLGGLAAFLIGTALHVGARGAFGLGDVKLMAGAGAAVGLMHVFDFIWAMAFAGAALALVYLVLCGGRRAAMPYGPAIAAGVACVLWWLR